MIAAENLSKRFGPRTAVAGVSFEVLRGEVVGFLGQNGAGKTTTLRMLAGVFPPTSGRALIAGHDVASEPMAARTRLGYAPERPALHTEMTVRDQLEFAAGLRADGSPVAAAQRAIGRTELGDVAGRRIGTLSKGYRQRVGLALALVGEPAALLLDEPLAGMDPAQSREMRDRIRAIADEGHAVLVSSHALADIELIADRVVILHRGRVIAVDSPAALARRLRPAACFDVEVGVPGETLARALAAIPGVERVAPLPSTAGTSRCRVHGGADTDLRAEVAARVVRAGWSLLALAPVETSLEEAFLRLIDDEGAR